MDESSITLGAHPQAEVFLCDPDVPDNLITLRRVGRRYEIETVNPEARLSSSDLKKVEETLFPSQVVTLDFRHIQLELQVVNLANGFTSLLRDSASRRVYRVLQFLRGLGARAIVAFLFVLSLVITTIILFFGTAGIVKSEASVKRSSMNAKQSPAPLPIESRIVSNVSEELSLFAQRANVNKFQLSSELKKVQVKAELSRAQGIEFEKLLARLARDYGNLIEIEAVVNLSQEQRTVDNIAVEQIVLGNKPVIVLRDGERLFVGGLYMGVTLIDIQSGKAIFKGDTVYEVVL